MKAVALVFGDGSVQLPDRTGPEGDQEMRALRPSADDPRPFVLYRARTRTGAAVGVATSAGLVESDSP
jgi:hypothetical protein